VEQLECTSNFVDQRVHYQRHEPKYGQVQLRIS
jgi:hypothetical protein